MGTPASSAIRATDAAQAATLQGAGGDPYGSLTGLGGPKKFKKKPVLVLDPEELERAHQLFQEGAAELVGGEYERPAKPATGLLGLAAMNDADSSPEDMGQTDDDLDGGDDEAIPTAEDLLRMTGSRAEEDEEEQAYAMQMLEQGFDEDHRIFPTLPVRPEEEIAAEEAAEAIEPAPPVAETPQAPLPEPAAEPRGYKPLNLTPGFVSLDDEDEEDDEIGWEGFAALTPEIRRDRPLRPAGPEEPVAAQAPAELPVEPRPEPEPEPQAAAPEEFAPRIEETTDEDAFSPYVAPFEPLRSTPEARTGGEPEAAELFAPAPEPEPEPEPQDEPPAAHVAPPAPIEPVAPVAYDFVAPEPEPEPAPEIDEAPRDLTPEEAQFAPLDEPAPQSDYEPELKYAPGQETAPQDWRTQEPAEETFAEDEVAPEAAPATLGNGWDDCDDGSLPEEAFADDYAQDDGSYTEIEDEPVDGYAFMHSESPRGRALRAAAPGEANSLRARLVRDREQEIEQSRQSRGGGSIFARFASWLRGLFG